MTEICWNCKYWQCDFNRNDEIEIVNYWNGQCKRHSPVMPIYVTLSHLPYRQEADAQWPRTNPGDSCGDFSRLVK